MGRGRRKKQVPRCARNDNLEVFRRFAEVWHWLRDSALLRVEAVRRSEKPHPLRDELQARVGAGAMARRGVGLGFVGPGAVAGGSQKPHPLRSELQRRVEVGVIRTVGVRGRAGSGSRSCP